MDSKIFDRLTECSADLAWQLVREDVVNQLIGEEVIPVPYINESEYYDLYSVIIKEPPGVMDKLRRKDRTMWVAGDLNALTRKDANNPPAVINEPETGSMVFNRDYTYHASDMRNGIRKTITVTMKHCQHSHLPVLANHGAVVLDTAAPGLKGIKKAYIIQGVYFVTDYSIHVVVGDQQTTENSQTRRTPIAFTFKKYVLMPQGMLGTQEKIDLKDIKKMFWIEKKGFRSPNDPLPAAPSDASGRRNPNDSLPPVPGHSKSRKDDPLPPVPTNRTD